MDFATDFLCRLGTLNQNMAIPIMCVIANLLDKSGDHVVKTDNDDVVLQRVNDIAFTISLNSAFQHIEITDINNPQNKINPSTTTNRENQRR